MHNSPRPRRSPDFDFQQIEEDVLLFQSGSTTGLWLNPTAALVWLLCDGQREVSEITDLLREQYPLEAQRVASDVHEAIDSLASRGAIVFE